MRHFIRQAKTPPRLPVIMDDRERQGFILPEDRFSVRTRRLLTGDYSFVGLESVVAIEKKSGLAEICSDLSGKNRPRFLRFLDRLSRYPVKLLLVEGNGPNDAFELIDYRGGTTPLFKTCNFWLSRMTTIYGIPVLFVGEPRVEELVINVFQDAYVVGIRFKNNGDIR
jgi:hypothetical protein